MLYETGAHVHLPLIGADGKRHLQSLQSFRGSSCGRHSRFEKSEALCPLMHLLEAPAVRRSVHISTQHVPGLCVQRG